MEHDYLLGCLQEECAEVIQAISKIKRFGPDEIQPAPKGNGKTNKEKLINELYDIFAIVQWLDDEEYFDLTLSEEEIDEIFQKKRDKVIKYYEAHK